MSQAAQTRQIPTHKRHGARLPRGAVLTIDFHPLQPARRARPERWGADCRPGRPGYRGRHLGPRLVEPADGSLHRTSRTPPALGVWSATASSGAAGGLFLGGLLTDLLGWRWVLFVNVPIVPLRTFRRRSLTLANIQSTAVGA
jgi:hypothetical protein